MWKSSAFLLTAYLFFHHMVQEVASDPECGVVPAASRTVDIYVNSRTNQSGDWIETFSARTEASNSSNNITLHVTHSVLDCDGKRIIHVRGVAKDDRPEYSSNSLLFHPRCGNNIEILNKGRTVQKIRLEDGLNSVVFTNRPLKNGEIFEVRLDKKNNKFGKSLAIGIIVRPPIEVDIIPEMHTSPIAWMMHHSHIFSNNLRLVANYGRNLDALQVGDHVGVMRNEFGTLHFFVNGVDQGAAVSNIPYPVYGVLELWFDAAKATIVDS